MCWPLYWMLRMTALITFPIWLEVPSTFQMTLGLTSSVGIQKCLTSSGDMKFSVAPLSMSAFMSEWIVLEWNLTGAWTYFCLGM